MVVFVRLSSVGQICPISQLMNEAFLKVPSPHGYSMSHVVPTPTTSGHSLVSCRQKGDKLQGWGAERCCRQVKDVIKERPYEIRPCSAEL